MAVTFTDGTTSGVVTKEVAPNSGVKIIKTHLPATFVWGTDILSIDLKKYGGMNLIGFLCFEQTTAGSVVIAATGTTAVTAGVLALTTTGSGANTVVGDIILFIE
jgi:hypothetical protein